jgi:subtilisin family serine protease
MFETKLGNLRKLGGALALAGAALWLATATGQELQTPSVPDHVQGEVIVKFRNTIDATRRNQNLNARSAQLVRRLDTVDIELVRIPAGQSVIEAVAAFKAMPDVELAQPNYVRSIVAPSPPNDPFWVNNTLYGLLRIQAQETWNTFNNHGSPSIIVAAIDTGVQYTHPDLAANMWTNPGEVPGNGVDDDGNGYIDDIYGIDAYNHDSNPIDDEGHGTHTAGTIAGVGNNGVGVVGVTWNSKILACKFLNSSGNGTDFGAIECFNYITWLKLHGQNIRVSSNSWGGNRGLPPGVPLPPSAAALKSAIDTAGANGILSSFAAGNNGSNNDTTPFDPASFDSPTIISVAASDQGDSRASFSNYGVTTVDLAAPGVSIVSTYPFFSGYASASGTSMASPHVAGAAALLLSIDPTLDVSALKNLMLANVDVLPQWQGLVATSGRLNVFRAAQAIGGNVAPSVSLTSPTAGETFTAPATVGLAATASDPDGTVTRVDFYANGGLIGSDNTSPFSFTWTNVAAGNYSLTAVAVDDDNASSVPSTAVPIVVNSGGGGQLNVALAANGGVATASSTHSSGYEPAGANNGDRRGSPWGSGGGWNDGTPDQFPDSIEVAFNGPKSLTEISVFSVQDNYLAPIEPTLGTTFTLYGLRDFEVQYWTGAAWQTVPGGAITTNNNVWRRVQFTALTTTKIRINITNALATWSRVAEIEALGTPVVSNPPTVALTSPANGATFTAPATVPLAATASDSDGIARVDFFADGNPIGSDTTPDQTGAYTASWTGVVAGNYSITAVATDNLGATATSPAANITVGGTTGRVNYALPANGGVATASSTHSPGYAASGAINGDRRGSSWGNGGGWNDGTPDSFPDTLEVQFGQSRTIDEINLFSVQDNYLSPVEPTLGMTFTQYGLTSFQVQYWNGAAWTDVPSGNISGNNAVWRQILFAPIATTAVRVVVNQALNTWSRIAEFEAVGGGSGPPPPPPPTGVNVALASNGATATASSVFSTGYVPSGAINGDRLGAPWGNGGGWNDATANVFPDWLEIQFSGSQTIDEIDVFSVQDNYTAPSNPTLGMTFTLYGLRNFQVEYWNGASWIVVPGGAVTNNSNVWKQFSFSPITTNRIRVWVTATPDQWSRITEVEAWTPDVAPSAPSALITRSDIADGSMPVLSAVSRAGANAGTSDVFSVAVLFRRDERETGRRPDLAGNVRHPAVARRGAEPRRALHQTGA